MEGIGTDFVSDGGLGVKMHSKEGKADSMEEFDYMAYLSCSGVNEGDIVDVVSDLRSMMITARKKKQKFDINHLIDSLQKLVGSNGTLLIRVFNWDFCHGKGFNSLTSISQAGSLGNYALKRKDFTRTAHPMYSWMVWGRYRDELVNLKNKEAFGIDSPFEFVYNHQGKLLNIGNTSVTGFTYAHYIEQKLQLPYRFEKNFIGEYTDSNGSTTIREYSMYVRYLDYDIYTELYPDVLEELEKEGIIHKREVFSLPVWSAKLHETIDFVYDDLKNNVGLCTCVVNGQKGYEYVINNPPHLVDPSQCVDPNDIIYPLLGSSITK